MAIVDRFFHPLTRAVQRNRPFAIAIAFIHSEFVEFFLSSPPFFQRRTFTETIEDPNATQNLKKILNLCQREHRY